MDTHGKEKKKLELKIVQYMFKGTGKKCVLYGGLGFPGGASDKEPAYLCKRLMRCRFNAWAKKIPWRRA